MRETEPSTGTPTRRRRTRLGNRALLATALAATLAAVACFGLLQAGAATTTAPAAAALAANEVSGSQANAAASTAKQAAAVPAADEMSGTQAKSAAAASTTSSVKVQIKGYAFAPAALSVPVGTTVTWTNYDTAPHTVTTSSGPKTISSPQLQTGQSFSYTFTAVGTYQYYCAVHPDMKATVTVLPAATATPTASAGPTTVPTATAVPTASASATPTSGMSGMPSSSPTSSTGSDCASVDQVLLPILNHINSAHLGESVGQQVQDALNLDQYIATHTAWIESILTPLASGGQSIVSSTLTTLLNHINSAHLDESLGQQISDILNPDQYIKTHTVWVSMLLAPTENYLTNNC
jgi:plastocyanin